MRRRKTKLQVKRGKMLGVWGEKCRFISLQSQSFDWCPPCTCFSRNVSIRVVGLDCGGRWRNFTFTSHFQTHLWSPLANDVALVVLIMCVEKKEDTWRPLIFFLSIAFSFANGRRALSIGADILFPPRCHIRSRICPDSPLLFPAFPPEKFSITKLESTSYVLAFLVTF